VKVVRIVPGEGLDRERAAALDGAVLTRDLDVGGQRWRKGRLLTPDEVRRLSVSAASDRPVTLLIPEPGDLHEDQAALRLAAVAAGSGLVQRGPNESRVDLHAAHAGVLHVRTAALERVDRIDPLEVFTRLDGQVVETGDLVASIKVAPHIVDEALVERAERIIGASGLVRVAPWLPRVVGVLVKQTLHAPARERFESSVRQKVEGLGSTMGAIRYVDDSTPPVLEALFAMTRGQERVDLVLTAGSASTDPLDPFFAAIDTLGGSIIRRGVPAHPGSMLWLARVGRTDIIGLPTCGAYSRATAADLLLPRLLSGERANARTVARLGHGGVLTREMRFRMPPYARDLEPGDG
jgi:molybdenum cofactor cytidylyltransferase